MSIYNAFLAKGVKNITQVFDVSGMVLRGRRRMRMNIDVGGNLDLFSFRRGEPRGAALPAI